MSICGGEGIFVGIFSGDAGSTLFFVVVSGLFILIGVSLLRHAARMIKEVKDDRDAE